VALSGHPAGSTSGPYHRDIVVVGASAGGVEALERFVAGFPPEAGAAIFVVLHVMPGGTSVLAQILQRKTALQCRPAQDGDPIERGRIYVAPPDHHMLLHRDGVTLSHGPRENGHRPAIDPLFRSAARAFGRRVIGVVLSGALDDGTAGLRMIVDAGGCAIVQTPREALYGSMPSSALTHVQRAESLPVADMAARICEIIDRPVSPAEPQVRAPQPNASEQPAAAHDPVANRGGNLTDLTCPECGGTLWETTESGVSRFRCHVGHVYSAGALDVSQSEALEAALWGALRSLQERGRLFRRLSQRSRDNRSVRYRIKADEANAHAAALRLLIEGIDREPGEADETGTADA
jgi:two-component system, chemotaxis family, protein-glutamate methylesterase/glutaminase